MNAVEAERLPKRPRAKLAPAKGSELLGLVLATAALLLLASLASYHPTDPSFLHELPPSRAHVDNFAGVFGAELAALLLGLLGSTALLLPLGLGAAAWTLLRRRERPRVAGRGTGFALLLLSLPVLLQLVLGRRVYRGEALDAGGVLGRFLAETLVARFNFPGSLLIVGALAVIAVSLVAQSTLAEAMGGWGARLALRWERLVLWWSRRRQRSEKEKLRKRVVSKHLKRREDEAAAVVMTPAPESVAGPELDLPLRVSGRLLDSKGDKKERERGFGVRRVRLAEELDLDEAILDGVDDDASERSALAAAETTAPASAPARRKKEQPLLFQPPSETQLPPLNLLNLQPVPHTIAEDDLIRLGEAIRQSCEHFGVEGTLEGINPGPVITVFEFRPAPGVKMSQIVGLQDDLALALQAESVRIDRIPGRSTLGIEVPNKDRSIIRLGSLLAHEKFRSAGSVLTMAIGTTLQGEPYFADLSTMPHLLVAGATGAGKSVGLQAMITSILYKASRDEVQFIFIDPKRVELGVYADIPHLKTDVVVEPKKAANALRWAVAEMERRYRLLAEVHVRSLDYYNRAIRDPEVQRRLALEETSEITQADLKPLPYYVIVIDELADLMMVAANEVETSIARLAQMARAVGIHLIVATQRPSVDVLTGTIKANFPCRISYATTSRHDSRTILDTVGSERLLGKGDMLIMPPGTSRLLRVHGAYISEQETAALVRWLKKTGKPSLDPEVVEFNGGGNGASGYGGEGPDGDDDELFEEASRLVVSEGKASASFLQRRMRIGFSRAARLIDLMEQDGILGPAQGSKPREVLVKGDYFAEVDATKD
ncbi:MAG TPA: DNA translocase FtsK 4TM domain-containing protein [Thermoanaerobaculia bacterium]|nr:DNA translocase FtsK 4TM domain-containing protein [Thermoanaerobaculia bacterium]